MLVDCLVVFSADIEGKRFMVKKVFNSVSPPVVSTEDEGNKGLFNFLRR